MVLSNKRRNKLILASAAAVGICLPTIIDTIIGLDSIVPSSYLRGRRGLAVSKKYLESSHSTLLPWAYHYLVGNDEAPNPEAESAVFWHVPKSGGTTVKNLYECMGHTLANRAGGMEQFGHAYDREIIVFQPFASSDLKTVNVDVTSKEGILRAKAMGLAASRKTDLIVTTEPHFAGEHLFDEVNRGRIMAMFRHPVDRAISKFYYLQTATWERTYRPEWQKLSAEEWAGMKKGNNDENFLVRKLNDKTFRDPVDETDLIFAKELLRQRFIVGLMNEMEESVRRFNIILGIDPWKDETAGRCMDQMFGEKEEEGGSSGKINSNKHPKVEKGSNAWNILAERNHLDILLFDYIVQLFDEQKAVIDSFPAIGTTQALEPAVSQIEAAPVEEAQAVVSSSEPFSQEDPQHDFTHQVQEARVEAPHHQSYSQESQPGVSQLQQYQSQEARVEAPKYGSYSQESQPAVSQSQQQEPVAQSAVSQSQQQELLSQFQSPKETQAAVSQSQQEEFLAQSAVSKSQQQELLSQFQSPKETQAAVSQSQQQELLAQFQPNPPESQQKFQSQEQESTLPLFEAPQSQAPQSQAPVPEAQESMSLSQLQALIAKYNTQNGQPAVSFEVQQEQATAQEEQQQEHTVPVFEPPHSRSIFEPPQSRSPQEEQPAPQAFSAVSGVPQYSTPQAAVYHEEPGIDDGSIGEAVSLNDVSAGAQWTEQHWQQGDGASASSVIEQQLDASTQQWSTEREQWQQGAVAEEQLQSNSQALSVNQELPKSTSYGTALESLELLRQFSKDGTLDLLRQWNQERTSDASDQAPVIIEELVEQDLSQWNQEEPAVIEELMQQDQSQWSDQAPVVIEELVQQDQSQWNQEASSGTSNHLKVSFGNEELQQEALASDQFLLNQVAQPLVGNEAPNQEDAADDLESWEELEALNAEQFRQEQEAVIAAEEERQELEADAAQEEQQQEPGSMAPPKALEQNELEQEAAAEKKRQQQLLKDADADEQNQEAGVSTKAGPLALEQIELEMEAAAEKQRLQQLLKAQKADEQQQGEQTAPKALEQIELEMEAAAEKKRLQQLMKYQMVDEQQQEEQTAPKDLEQSELEMEEAAAEKKLLQQLMKSQMVDEQQQEEQTSEKVVYQDLEAMEAVLGYVPSKHQDGDA